MNHTFSIFIKYNNGEIVHSHIIINTDSDQQFKIWQWALVHARALAEHEKAELIQVIRLS